VAPAPKAGKRRSAAVPIEPPAGSAAADFDENGVPVYNVQRAWAEYEKRKHEEQKRQKTTLEVMELEQQLYRVETVEQAWGRAVNMTRTKILGVPSRAKQQIPHLTPDEIELIRDLLREALEELAAGEVTK
jgi:phage terminase Nu1 subunit (DNA packaging protein)